MIDEIASNKKQLNGMKSCKLILPEIAVKLPPERVAAVRQHKREVPIHQLF